VTRACTRPGCDGEIEDDGFCDTCGRAPEAAPAAEGSAEGSAEGPATAATRGPGVAAAGTGSGATPSGATPSGRTASARTASGRTRSGSTRRLIGAGLVEIAPEPAADPAEAVMTEAVVPESSRYCAVCDAAVGRGRDDRPGRTEGFCPQCGTRFSFTPTLRAGDLVAGQYEILGALAHGGLGWVYLARDRKVRDRWVVLKGLLNTGDAAALAAADAEQGFLAQLVHPRIVRIYNVVTGDDGATYIVMEYIGGRSLKAMRDPREPMAPEQALAYVLEVLPALSHMHERGLLYCDFKPDNVVQTGTDVTLIDLGAVRRMDDPGGDVWGTVGYQAPEISPDGVGPSVASDVYTVGRTLAVLVATFDFHRSMRDRLPDPHEAPALTHEPLRRLLARATDRDPTRRFVSIDEMSDQMIGVLRRLTARHATPPPRLSTMFAAPSVSAGITAPVTPEELAAAMPAPRPDPDDPATPVLVAAAAQGPAAVLAAVSAQDGASGATGEGRASGATGEGRASGATGEGRAPDSDQARLSAVVAHLDAGDTGAAGEALAAHALPGEWTWTWLRARHAAATGDADTAAALVDEVADALPGEPAPEFALAALGEYRAARGEGAAGPVVEERFADLWRTDRTWTGAAFALARLRTAAGDRAGAVAVLDEVPASSVHAADARVAAVRVLLGTRHDGRLTRSTVMEAGARAEAIDLDALRAAELQTEVLEAARGLDDAGGDGAGRDGAVGDLFGCPLDDRGLGLGIEERYRLRARFADSPAARFALVDAANDARPWTAR
jgi:serine/threonine-protein kinase PknG